MLNPSDSSEPIHPTTAGPGAREAGIVQEASPRRRLLRLFGPGIIAGASDDDPATIGTCAKIGASLGFSTLWTMLATIPLMAAVQYATAKIGQVTGRGLGGVIRMHYPRAVLYPLLIGLILANAINAGADLGAMAAALHLLVPIPAGALILPLASVIVALQLWGNYRMIERLFRWLTLALFAYIAAAILARPDWLAVLRGTFVPTFRFDRTFLEAMVAIIGTTFSPYLYFWQASQEVEEKVEMGRRRLPERRGTTPQELKYTAWDVNIGMVMSNLVTYFIILASGATLYRTGQHDVQTAEQLAVALRPLAGEGASVLLVIGLLGTGFLAVPVLTTSAAYAVSETFHWRFGLNRSPATARQFYGIIVLATLVGMEINYLGISPIAALFWTSVLYGFLAPPLLLLIVLISSNRRIMGDHVNGLGLTILGWIAVFVSLVAAIGLVWSWWAG